VAVGIPEGETFGIVTICPPYEEVVYADLLDAVANSPAVTEDTIVLMEYPVELWGDLPHVYSGETTTMIGIRNRKYGRTVIAMYICNPTGKIEDAESRPEEFV
jgi:16S rRNA G966 N2-methylase RsmD